MEEKTSFLERKILNDVLFNQGFLAIDIIPNKDLPKRLSSFMLDYAGGKYNDVRVIPGELAFEGFEWQPVEPSHMIYVKHKNPKDRSIHGLPVAMINRDGVRSVINIHHDPNVWDYEAGF